jgi:hypothetical protein
MPFVVFAKAGMCEKALCPAIWVNGGVTTAEFLRIPVPMMILTHVVVTVERIKYLGDIVVLGRLWRAELGTGPPFVALPYASSSLMHAAAISGSWAALVHRPRASSTPQCIRSSSVPLAAPRKNFFLHRHPCRGQSRTACTSCAQAYGATTPHNFGRC